MSRRGKNWEVEPLWTTSNLKQSYVTPVYHGGRLFGMSNRILVCLDATNGEIVWRYLSRTSDGKRTVVRAFRYPPELVEPLLGN